MRGERGTWRYPREFPVNSTVSVSFTCMAVTEWSPLSQLDREWRRLSQILNSPTSPPPLVFHTWTHPPDPQATREPTVGEGSLCLRNSS